MKKVLITILVCSLLAGCKKTIERIQENAVLDAMTDGQWVITNFVHNGTNITSDFNGYKFQYHRNYTVDAIKGGTVEQTGTWDGDPNTMTITAQFSIASHPLSLINGAWHIDNNSWTYVVASQTTTGGSSSLRLEKL